MLSVQRVQINLDSKAMAQTQYPASAVYLSKKEKQARKI